MKEPVCHCITQSYLNVLKDDFIGRFILWHVIYSLYRRFLKFPFFKICYFVTAFIFLRFITFIATVFIFLAEILRLLPP
jgi:hypothetical protein